LKILESSSKKKCLKEVVRKLEFGPLDKCKDNFGDEKSLFCIPEEDINRFEDEITDCMDLSYDADIGKYMFYQDEDQF